MYDIFLFGISAVECELNRMKFFCTSESFPFTPNSM